ncbi:hypothetical protein NDU88_006138 [Pleurodeles waltl]|uniref:Uncharacterized protein n=1 Tax=Pleurodeles waltl TaxID=8319 RepID=A0AAV7MD18_PLEWA|nr:hypothetical protein NDU88_006138 [Pleurodeles waltl]
MSRVCAWIFLLVFRLRVVLRGCASKLRSHGRRCVDFSSRSRAGLSLRSRASDFRSSQERRVDQRRCAAFFSPQNKLCVEIFSARSVQVKEGSLFGPETSENRRQALSKPLESTFTARQEFSKAAVLCRKQTGTFQDDDQFSGTPLLMTSVRVGPPQVVDQNDLDYLNIELSSFGEVPVYTLHLPWMEFVIRIRLS